MKLKIFEKSLLIFVFLKTQNLQYRHFDIIKIVSSGDYYKNQFYLSEKVCFVANYLKNNLNT
jgi:ribosomal protein L35AE/L33A